MAHQVSRSVEIIPNLGACLALSGLDRDHMARSLVVLEGAHPVEYGGVDELLLMKEKELRVTRIVGEGRVHDVGGLDVDDHFALDAVFLAEGVDARDDAVVLQDALHGRTLP